MLAPRRPPLNPCRAVLFRFPRQSFRMRPDFMRFPDAAPALSHMCSRAARGKPDPHVPVPAKDQGAVARGIDRSSKTSAKKHEVGRQPDGAHCYCALSAAGQKNSNTPLFGTCPSRKVASVGITSKVVGLFYFFILYI